MDIKKQYIILAIMAGFLIVIFVILVLIQSNLEKSADVASSPQGTITPASSNTQEGNQAPDTNQPGKENATSPEDISLEFYNFYISLKNPLATGEYKKSKYILPDISQFAEKIYNGSDDPIFCLENRRSEVAIEPAVYSTDGKVAYVVLKEKGLDNKQLYDLELEKENGVWRIETIQCL